MSNDKPENVVVPPSVEIPPPNENQVDPEAGDKPNGPITVTKPQGT